MNANCWNMWSGGEYDEHPAPDSIVDLVTVNSTKLRIKAGMVDWTLTGAPTDVMFYRVVTVQPDVVVLPTAPSILQKAASIMEERGRQYDKPDGEHSMGQAVVAFNAITGKALQESEGWLLLQVLKDVRDRQRVKAHVDSLEDCVAYSALKAEARMAGK